MSVITRQEDIQPDQPYEAEELVRGLGDLPQVSPEFRSRVLVAASQAASEAKRQRGWVIATAFAAACAVCVLVVAFFGTGYPAADTMANDQATELAPTEEAVNKALVDPEKVISSGMLSR